MPDGMHFTVGQLSPAIVLNADVRSLSSFPLFAWAWQDAVKAVFLDRVSELSECETVVHSPRATMRLPSVVALKKYTQAAVRPAFTRFNVFLRETFACQYCGRNRPTPELAFDDVTPRSHGGRINRALFYLSTTVPFFLFQRLSNNICRLAGMADVVKPAASWRRRCSL